MNTQKWSGQLSRYVAAFACGVLFCLINFLPSTANAIADDLSSPATEVAAISPSAVTNPNSFVAAAVTKTGSAVVRIDTETVVTRRVDPMFEDPFFQQFFGGTFSPPPQEQRISGQGSGFIIDSSGIILTNAHVVNRANQVTVTLKDGRKFAGEVRGADEVTDLAVVKIDPQGESLPIASLGNSDAIHVGDWAIAVGNPVGLDNTVTLGIISTLSRPAAQAGIPDKRVEFIQTDAAINPGNSGGPLLNANGDVVGINTAIRADAMGIGFAIPINQAKSIQQTLAAGQAVPHPFIGIQMINITQQEAQGNNRNPNAPFLLPEADGILVTKVLPGTPAETAGMRRGDLIVAVDGQPIDDGGKLQKLVEQTRIGQTLKLSILRGERQLTLAVRTAQMSDIRG